ncbi:MAG: hypothetical protein RBR35_09885 [Salinivirgaceae bacterium]|nr:hypothetical protein [Salinivirgaceae bacterium]
MITRFFTSLRFFQNDNELELYEEGLAEAAAPAKPSSTITP